MKRPPKAVLIGLGLAAVAAIAAWAFWPKGGEETLAGYVEGETLYFAAPSSGLVGRLMVERGQRVAAGQLLFEMDYAVEAAQVAQNRFGAQAANERLQDAMKGQRPQELAVIRAQRASAQAVLNQAQSDYRRIKVLTDKGIYARARLDQAEAALGTARAQFDEVQKRLDVAELGARQDQEDAAASQAGQAQAALDESNLRFGQLAPVTPVAGRIEDVFFRPGERASVNAPVVALLPDDRVKIRFFVPEADLPKYRPGTKVRFSCDGCRGGEAVVRYVSPRPEFSPPVLYSRGNRERLVFLVEASPERPGELAPGQPVDVAKVR